MKLLLVIAALVVVAVAVLAYVTLSMPGRSHRGPLPAATPAQQALAEELRRDVTALCEHSPRTAFVPENLHAAAAYVERSLAASGHCVEKQRFEVDGVACENLSVEIRGTSTPDEIVVIGAHYDTVDITVGADDNGSGTAALLALARRFANARPARTLRFVAFVNEEPPHFKSRDMGSYRYARAAKERKEKIVAMLSLEMLGYYDDRPGSQQYPPPLSSLYPNTGNFIGFAGNLGSRALVKRCLATFRRTTPFPSEAAVLPELIQEIGWSDQWSFWQFGYPALMVTDTALFRNPHYHSGSDTPRTLHYDRMARVVEGLHAVVDDLTSQ